MSDRERVIIDCDPGQDDALMLFLALGADQFDVAGIIAVAGNVPLEKTARNLAMVVELAGRDDLKLFAGCERPMMRPLVTAEYVHGQTGINGMEVFEPSIPIRSEHGVDFLVRDLGEAGEASTTIVATGPLTDIAMALVRAPAIAGSIKQIVIMGGASFEAGNVTPSAEFNIYVDPHAADIVLKSGIPITMFGLDVTHKVMTNPQIVGRIRNLNSPVALACAGMLDYFGKFDSEKYSSQGGPLHDPCTVAWLLKPELFKLKSCAVQVETNSALTMGHTAVDFWKVTGQAPNVQWAHDVDAEGFFELLIQSLSRYPA